MIRCVIHYSQRLIGNIGKELFSEPLEEQFLIHLPEIVACFPGTFENKFCMGSLPGLANRVNNNEAFAFASPLLGPGLDFIGVPNKVITMILVDV